jgi:uncharacterized protein YcaQ
MVDMQVLQLDSVNVCVRSHYMPLFSRLGSYRKELIDEMTYQDKEYFEYWGHVASLVPTEMYSLFEFRRDREWIWGNLKEVLAERPGFAAEIEERVRREGPVRTGDLEEPGQRTGAWWGHSATKHVLEHLFGKGLVVTARRHNFTRYYDTPEKALPSHVFGQQVHDRESSYRELILSGCRGVGVGTVEDILDWWRLNKPIGRPIFADLVSEGLIEEVLVDGWDKPAFMLPGTRVPRSIDAQALLTPFDPVVWNRDRALRLYGFHYRIEIYVPEPKRQYGYYVYPFLLGDAIVARVDLKSDRAAGVLLAQASWLEDGQDPQHVGRKLRESLEEMAAWLGLDSVTVVDKGTPALVQVLARN